MEISQISSVIYPKIREHGIKKAKLFHRSEN